VGNSWAVFSTLNTTNTLFARVNVNGTTQDVSLGSLPSGFHLYRVEPTSSGFKFYVDGQLKTTVAGTFPTGTALHVVLSASSSTPVLKVDGVRIADYAASGTYTSTTLDAGKSVNWQTVNWTAGVPAGTTMKIEISVSDDATNWSAWTLVSDNSILSNVKGRYLRYRVTFTTTDPTLSAVLDDITFTWT